MSFNFSPKIVTDGLVSFYDAGNNASLTNPIVSWNDLMVTGNHLSTGSAYGGAFPSTKDTGNLGNVAVTWPNYAWRNTTNSLPSSTCTILVWCRPYYYWNLFGGEPYAGIVSWGTRTNATPSNGILLSAQVPNSYGPIYVSSAYWYNDYVPSVLEIKRGKWNMVGLIARQGAILNNTTHICGNDSGLNFNTGTSAAYTRTLNFTNINLRIGLTDTSPSSFSGFRAFSGWIATVMIYNRELSTQEVQRNFDAHRGRFDLNQIRYDSP